MKTNLVRQEIFLGKEKEENVIVKYKYSNKNLEQILRGFKKIGLKQNLR